MSRIEELFPSEDYDGYDESHEPQTPDEHAAAVAEPPRVTVSMPTLAELRAQMAIVDRLFDRIRWDASVRSRRALVPLSLVNVLAGVLEGGEWRTARASGVAVVLVDPDAAASRREWDRYENAARDAATLEVCERVAYALENAIDWHVTQQLTRARASFEHVRAAALDSFPGYTFIRNYLVDELFARPVIACTVAMKLAVRNAAHRRRFLLERGYRMQAENERGWL